MFGINWGDGEPGGRSNMHGNDVVEEKAEAQPPPPPDYEVSIAKFARFAGYVMILAGVVFFSLFLGKPDAWWILLGVFYAGCVISAANEKIKLSRISNP
jgi:hypothetical protein